MAGGPASRPRLTAEYDYRGSGYVYGAFVPETGAAFTAWYAGRRTESWAEFLSDVERWLDTRYTRVIAIQDNLSTHFGLDIQLFNLAHPRWEFLNIPAGAGYLNLIESWWKVLKGLALNGKRFQSWKDLSEAIRDATAYWNRYRHPFTWGQRKRHQPKRKPGIARMPGHRLTA